MTHNYVWDIQLNELKSIIDHIRYLHSLAKSVTIERHMTTVVAVVSIGNILKFEI